MISSYRKRHLSIWVLLGLVLPALFVMAFNVRKGIISSDIVLDERSLAGEGTVIDASKEWGTFEVYEIKDTTDTLSHFILKADFINHQNLASTWIETTNEKGQSFLLGQFNRNGLHYFNMPDSYTPEETWQLSIQDKIKDRILYQTER